MSILTNPADNGSINALARQAPQNVLSAVRQASSRTGVDFAYLLRQAKAESSFDTQAKAGTSSASGLYQFIESTWLQMVRDHGHKYGLEDKAAQIGKDCKVSDPAARREILGLRNDPEISSLLAAEFASGNKDFLERHWGGEVGSTELYFAHFMGAGGAASFLQAMDENPLRYGADLFPKEATSNRGVFYDRESGEPRTLAAIYDFFDKKFSPAVNDGGTQELKVAETQENPSLPEPQPATCPAAVCGNIYSRSSLLTLSRPAMEHVPYSPGHGFLLAPHDILLLDLLRSAEI